MNMDLKVGLFVLSLAFPSCACHHQLACAMPAGPGAGVAQTDWPRAGVAWGRHLPASSHKQARQGARPGAFLWEGQTLGALEDPPRGGNDPDRGLSQVPQTTQGQKSSRFSCSASVLGTPRFIYTIADASRKSDFLNK
ncbi:hypothetical protein AAFF_G00263220 [Aldrovandia affinis]|uniref:Uncharacterized protein n=1 Tax=Aldrovandia affinis TaxID=143900 RepID=A0AAD7SSR3_9TELE|nr:hypothetical protein AAFF_G00263220 [Aldrovandia affinis]